MVKVMKCKICGKDSNYIFNAIVLHKYKINYFYCPNCHFLQTENPYWLPEAYQNPINESDTGILVRNLHLYKKVSVLISFLYNSSGTFLDYAGGYGLFVRLMRDVGFDFYWYDKYAENIFAKGFNIKLNGNLQFDLITCFETFEHFDSPKEEIEMLLTKTENLFFTTLLLPQPTPQPTDWWYYGLDHGQHISFFTQATFNFLAKKYNYFYYTNGNNLHFFSKKNKNPLAIKILLKNANYLFFFIKRKLTSKTWSDHLIIKKGNESNYK